MKIIGLNARTLSEQIKEMFSKIGTLGTAATKNVNEAGGVCGLTSQGKVAYMYLPDAVPHDRDITPLLAVGGTVTFDTYITEDMLLHDNFYVKSATAFYNHKTKMQVSYDGVIMFSAFIPDALNTDNILSLRCITAIIDPNDTSNKTLICTKSVIKVVS